MNTPSRWHDPVVAEVHAIREQLANHDHDDLLAYSKAAKARCRALALTMTEDLNKIAQLSTPACGVATRA